jgi:hypothetical protein
MPPRLFPLRLLLPALAALRTLAGCDSHADNVCSDIGDCAQGGSYQFVEACQAQAQDLSNEAYASGCGALFDGYYACADSNYDCTGITPTFAGCEGALAALESCLKKGEAKNACGMLAAALAACPGSADAGTLSPAGADAGSSSTPDPPCDIGGVCQAHCYLTSIANVCAPRPTELGAFAQCASQCTF